jgi:hypothetical protein
MEKGSVMSISHLYLVQGLRICGKLFPLPTCFHDDGKQSLQERLMYNEVMEGTSCGLH